MKSQTAFLEGALGAPQKESRRSWSAFHVPEGSFTLSHNYLIALSTAWSLGFRETMDNTRPSKMRVLLTQSHSFHHIAPPRTDGQTEALGPAEGQLQLLPFVKGNFTTTNDQEDTNREPPVKVKNHSSSFPTPLLAMTVRTNANKEFVLNSFWKHFLRPWCISHNKEKRYKRTRNSLRMIRVNYNHFKNKIIKEKTKNTTTVLRLGLFHILKNPI